jgi:STE24 endopeptidase
MPIVLLLLTLAACFSLGRIERPEWLSPSQSVLLTVLTMSISIVVTFSRATAYRNQLLSGASSFREVSRSYSSFRRWMPFVSLFCAVVGVVLWGWGETATAWAKCTIRGRSIYWPAIELLIPLPYYATLIVNWLLYFRLEKELFARSREGEEFWSVWGYLSFQTRQMFLILGLPVTLCVVGQTLTRFFPETMALTEVQLASLGATIVVFVFFPQLLPSLLQLDRLPPGKIRDDLTEVGVRMGVQFRDVLVWPTRGLIVNALVVGVIRPCRYVIFTDRLLKTMEPHELRAVFGHEAGHVRHHHLPFYLLFFLMSGTFITLLGQMMILLLTGAIPQLEGESDLLEFLPVLMMVGWMLIVFGWLSRTCEAQADLAGARAGSCANPDCHEHTTETVYATAPVICRTGLHAMIAALDRVGDRGTDSQVSLTKRLLAWVQAWQHGPLGHRIDRLLYLANHPEQAAAIDRHAFRVRLFLALSLFAGIVSLLYIMGWAEFWRAMS